MTNQMDNPEEHLTQNELDRRIEAMQVKYRDGELTAREARELDRLKNARSIITQAGSPRWY